MRTIRLFGMAALAAAAFIKTSAPAAQPEPSAESIDAPEGPWRQLIRYTPREGQAGGISLWIEESAIVPEGAEPPFRARQPRVVRELWVNHGAARAGGQVYRIEHNRYHCGDGGLVHLAHAAFTHDGRQLIAVPGDAERLPVVPHSAESAVAHAVCDNGIAARRGETASTIADAVSAAPSNVVRPEPVQELTADLDADGRLEILRAHMRPHSMRIDVELIPGRDQTRPFNIFAVEQPPTGPLVQSRLRYVSPNTYLYACERQENRDAEPCRGGVANVVRGGIEVITPGQPSLLIWVPDREPRIVRLPAVPPPAPIPLPISHHDRPLPTGVTYLGTLGRDCAGRTLPDGRPYAENVHGLMPGQRIGLTLASPDFAPILQVFREGEADRPLASWTAEADGRGVTRVFEAPDEADYVFRVTPRDPQALGLWQVQLTYGGAPEQGAEASPASWPHQAQAHGGCSAR